MTKKPADIIEWVVPAHETSILAGASGAGKTTLIMNIIKKLQNNESVFGYPATPNLKIGYIAADRTWEAYKVLAATTGVDTTRLKIRALIDDDDIDTDRFEHDPQGILYSLLLDMAKSGIDLVIVDPLVVFLGCATNIYHMNAARLIRLNRFCRQKSITVLGTHHATKARTDYGFKRPQDRISGSSALLGFTSTQLFLAAAEETETKEYAEWHIISHHAPPKVVLLKRDEQGRFEEAPQIPEPIDISAFHPVIDDTDVGGAIIKFLPADGTPVQRKQIVSNLTQMASPRTIDERLKFLSTTGTLKKYDGGFYGLVL